MVLFTPIPAPKRNKVPRYVPRQLDRLEARKEVAIANVAPKLVGAENVAVAEEILKELRDEMLDELDAIERELLPPQT